MKSAGAEWVRSLIDQQFSSLGINANYGFAILNADNCTSRVASDDYKLRPAGSRQNIPNHYSLMKENRLTYFLAIYSPNKRLDLLHSIFWIIALSEIVILVIYTASLFYMNRQKKISEVKNDFINNMTHEFKMPIATISLAAEALENPVIGKNPERVTYYSRLIKNENMRMNDQVELVFKMSRLEHNQILDHVHKPKNRYKIPDLRMYFC